MDGRLNSGLHDGICRVIGQEIGEKSTSDGSNQYHRSKLVERTMLIFQSANHYHRVTHFIYFCERIEERRSLTTCLLIKKSDKQAI